MRPLALLSLAGALFLAGDAVLTQDSEKSIYLSVLDASGNPVTGLTAADFAIREEGVDREIVSAKAATEPLRVALLADTSSGESLYVRDIRAGLRTFIREVLTQSPEAQISLWEFGQASVRLKDFTSDKAALDEDAGRIYPKPRAASVLLEALFDTSEALGRRPSPRRAIVLLNFEPGDEQSRQEPKKINDSLSRSRAQVWAVSVQKEGLENAKRDVVLNTLVRNAGGQREFIVASSAIELYMRRYAAALTTQYELRYRRASGRPQIVQTGVRREGARVIASIFAPQ